MNNYESSDIKILSDIEHVRLRAGMYIGELTYPTQILNEIIDNALDESQSGSNNLTEIHINSELHEYQVRDYGRGIPIGIIRYDNQEIESIQALYTKTNSGAKFDSNTYKVRSGLHGVGGVCANALSSKFKAQTFRNGKSVILECEKGVVTSLNYVDTNEPNGVHITFIPDSSIFESTYIPEDLVINRCKIAKSMGYEIKLYIDEKEINVGISNLLELLPQESISSYCQTILRITDDNGESLLIGIRYTSATNHREYGYTNLLPNQYGGTHINVVNDSIIKCWQLYAGESHEFKPNDSMLGMRSVVACFIDNAAFSSQTKDKLTVPRTRFKNLSEKFEKEFLKWLKSNRELADQLIKRFDDYRHNINSIESQKEIMSKIKIAEIDESTNSTRRGSSIVQKLIDCSSRSRENTELFICEGDSAAGGIARPRDKITQAVLPLRGKVQNVANLTIKQALTHPTMVDIVNSIGAGVGEASDPSKSRYERIIITTDADPDGMHIVALVLIGLVNLVPNIVKAGMVYVLESPLYGWWDKKGNKSYSSNFEEVNQEDYNAGRFVRYKGLGSMDDSDFKNACLDLSNRVMHRIEYPTDIEEFNWIAGTSEGRSDLLSRYGVLIKSNKENEG